MSEFLRRLSCCLAVPNKKKRLPTNTATPTLRSGGFALLAALLAVVAVSMAAAVAISHARTEIRREKEAQLLWVGNQYRQAIRSYQTVVPPNGKAQYPQKLEDLLDDRRFPQPVRHLRRFYVDPFSGKADWVPVMEGDRIVGVHSASNLQPIRSTNLGLGNSTLTAVRAYADWQFLASDAAEPRAVPGTSAGTPATPVGGGDVPADNEPPPPPDPATQARAACYMKYGGPPMIICKGPSFPAGNDALSCRLEMARLIGECLTSGGGQ